MPHREGFGQESEAGMRGKPRSGALFPEKGKAKQDRGFRTG